MKIEQLTNQLLKFYTAHDLVFNLVITALLLICASLLKRWITARLPDDLDIEQRRKKLISIRNNTALVLISLLILLWASELKTFTVSILAIAVALVVATKEVILSGIGGVLRITTKKYTIGDRIEIKNLKGHVIDITFLYTTIMELGPGKYIHQYTGRTISFPNSLLVVEPLHVESFTDDCSPHTVQIPLHKDTLDMISAATELKRIAEEICKPYLENADAYVLKIQAQNSIDMPSPKPRVLINPDEKGEWWLTLRFIVPVKEKIRIEQEILNKFLRSDTLARRK